MIGLRKQQRHEFFNPRSFRNTPNPNPDQMVLKPPYQHWNFYNHPVNGYQIWMTKWSSRHFECGN